MACVTTVRYSIRFNRHLFDSVTPSRGLRPCDPLSPYLFLFVGDGLPCLIRNKYKSVPYMNCTFARELRGFRTYCSPMIASFFEGSIDRALLVKSIIHVGQI
jgi:hypothetical protein